MSVPSAADRHERPRNTSFSCRSAEVVLALCVSVIALLASSAVASALNVSGTWNANYHCEVGWCAGLDFPAPGVVLTQAPGSTVVTSGPTVSGTLIGNTLTLDGGEAGGYTFHEVLTIASDGKSWSGPLSDSNGTSGTDTATRVSGGGTATVSGTVRDVYENTIGGVSVKLTGKSDSEEEISHTDVTGGSGTYSFEVPPGTYEVSTSGNPAEQNGGTFEVAKPAPSGTLSAGEVPAPEPTSTAPECSGTASGSTCKLGHLEGGETGSANFAYTYCTAAERSVDGKPVSGCPIIFIPGFLGSRIVCGSHELWPNLPTGVSTVLSKAEFGDLKLESDGATNAGAPGSCEKEAHTETGQAGLVGSAAGADIYGSVTDYLNRIVSHGVLKTEHGAYAFPYDWRKSPLTAAQALDSYVDQVLKKTGAKHVTLMAHSMGGLVLQAYVADPGHAEKVARAITLGTPYWGAPKSHTALLTAKSGEPKVELLSLDLFLRASSLQTAAQNMQGLYWLYPSANFGPWLKVNLTGGTRSGLTITPGSKTGLKLGSWLNSTEIGPWVTALGGTAALEANAVAGHAMLDGFKTNHVPYQIVVGVGVPTITKMEVTESVFEPARLTPSEDYEGEQTVNVTFGSGDGTVPAVSATQGVSEGKAPLAESVPIDYECNVEHVGLPGNATVQTKIEGFLLRGDAVTSGASCPYTGAETELVKLKGSGAVFLASATHEGVTVQSGSTTLTLQAAVQQGLIQVIPNAGRTIIVTDTATPVTLNVNATRFTLKVRALKSAAKGSAGVTGPAQFYGPLSGNVSIGDTGAVTRGGKAVKGHHGQRPPHTTAHITRHGRFYLVKLRVHDKVAVLGTFVRIGAGKPHRYHGTLKLTKTQLKRLSFASVDVYGSWERSERAHAPR